MTISFFVSGSFGLSSAEVEGVTTSGAAEATDVGAGAVVVVVAAAGELIVAV